MAMTDHVVLLVGGVGGAKLALGFQQILPPDQLTIIVNTGDDFWHWGLRICPDLDTVLYTLAGRVDQNTGWGVADDTTHALETLAEITPDAAWFRLGDRDLATHLYRTGRLGQGATLTQVIDELRRGMGVGPAILPMTDSVVATLVHTVDQGMMAFQEYFVRNRWLPAVRQITYEGADAAVISPEVQRALEAATLLVIAPSNPWLSIAPILAVAGMTETLASLAIPRIAVSPIVAGRAIKGPTAKLMKELGYAATPAVIMHKYRSVIDGYVYDLRDEPLLPDLAIRMLQADTLMMTEADKRALAAAILAWQHELHLAEPEFAE
jgi:LPPG:FO 2-phospho-L-lactate transferase